MADQISEYESQLAEVQTLLDLSPTDESLLSLKSDLVELLTITKGNNSNTARNDETTKTSTNVFDRAMEAALGQSIGRDDDLPPSIAPAASSFVDTILEAADDVPLTISTTTAATDELPKKKQSTVKAEFVVPQHLIGLDTDTTAERNKKQRALKALKSKWREAKKEAESNTKQKSWQSFQKKKKVKTCSIFQTGDESAVGVVSLGGKRQLTEFGERKRHKHDE